MIVFPCQHCQASLSANETQVGILVRCPTCQNTMRVPSGAAAGVTTAPGDARPPGGYGSAFMTRGTGRRYGFNCAHCSSRLEATESMAAQDGQCPTCGNMITIPILDRYGRLIDPKTREVIKLPPHPVHAYAAAGDRAPRILRHNDGRQIILCPRCNAQSPIGANNCRACGMPFTMEGTTVEAAGNSNGFCVASLVLGIVGIPASCSIILPILAIVFGGIGYAQVSSNDAVRGGKGLAIAGIICGLVSCLLGLLFHMS
jgi:phage FluMu protein Com